MTPQQPQAQDLPDFEGLALVDLDDDLLAPAPLAPSATKDDTTVRRPATAPAASPAEADQGFRDWTVVDLIRGEVADALAEEDSPGTDDEDRRARAISLIGHYIDDEENRRLDQGLVQWSNAERRAITQAVLESLFGFGRLQPLLDDTSIENIEIYGYDDILVQHTDNAFSEAEPVAESDEDLLSTLSFYAAKIGRSFDPAHPRLHMSLGPTARLQATGWVIDRPVATIRIHRLVDISLNDLVDLGMMPTELARFLRAAVRARKSIMIGGAQGAGKTTLLRGLINEIDAWEKLATLESTYELHLDQLGKERHRRLIALEAVPGSDEKDANGRPIGEITMDDWARDTFRMNLDRLIVGEILGPEVIAMFEAMQTGAGSLSTIHAKSSAAIPERIVTLARKDGRVTEDFARRQVAENIDLAVYVDVVKTRNPWTGESSLTRRITDVTTYQPGEGGRVASTQLWSLEDDRLVPHLSPEWIEDLRPHLDDEEAA
ncbi:CpaF family protein [Brachybacterium sacelli]|uniref:Flp pilus assembly CpaF family ATPase n=1 Tax=Brachybacterium sacelli TaxID=173364 RepID=A0ABS4WWT2_9MICO|nr:ATPase, T2SS/T4P/T4SS family [Brachybacterium sacelli]MBP2380670.1 Flp pilus assembly CpaF family ATPase [Brachybacterium sacelli]